MAKDKKKCKHPTVTRMESDTRVWYLCEACGEVDTTWVKGDEPKGPNPYAN